jgi:hypothetical protein
VSENFSAWHRRDAVFSSPGSPADGTGGMWTAMDAMNSKTRLESRPILPATGLAGSRNPTAHTPKYEEPVKGHGSYILRERIAEHIFWVIR